MHSAYLVLDTYRFMLGCIQSDYGILLTAQSNASTVSTEKADWKHDLAAIKLDVHQKQSTPWCFFFDLSSRKNVVYVARYLCPSSATYVDHCKSDKCASVLLFIELTDLIGLLSWLQKAMNIKSSVLMFRLHSLGCILCTNSTECIGTTEPMPILKKLYTIRPVYTL